MLVSGICEGRRQFMQFSVTVILSSLAYFFSTGIYTYWLLTWLAPIPLLLYALRAAAPSVIFASLITCFIGFASGSLAYVNTVIPVSLLIYGNMMRAIIYTILVMLFRYMVLRKKHWAWSFILASGWTVFEFVAAHGSPAGTIDSIAYTQIFNLPVIQIASITGIWGISFLLMLVPAGVTLAWHYRECSSLALKALAIPVGILIVVLTFGLYRLSVPNQGATVKVGMAAIHVSMEELLSRGRQQTAEQMIDKYIQCIDALSSSGVEVILLPEKIAALNPDDKDKLLGLFAEVARKNQVALIVCMDVEQEEKVYNSAYLILSTGEIVLQYAKQHLLPYAEGRYTSGEKLGIRDMGDKGWWGVAICKDMDFTEPSRGYSQAGINILFVPALDFKIDSLLHGRVAIMRGVEENYAVARAAQWGLLSLSDSKGKISKAASNAEAVDDVLLIGEIPLGQGKSLYSRFGDWFGYFVEGLFVLLIICFLKLNRSKHGMLKDNTKLLKW